MLEQLTHAVTDLVQHHGLVAIFALMLVESACIPVPAEVTMLYAGYLATQHDVSFTGAVVAGVVGNTVGSLLMWGIGASGGRRVLERHGRWIGIRTKHLDVADRWFEQRGSSAVLISRCLPVVRTFISLPAGVARMPLASFTALTVLGCIPFVAAFTALGVVLGPQWNQLHGVLRIFDVLVVGVIVAVAVAVWRRTRARAAA